jgi:hypothetical protein
MNSYRILLSYVLVLISSVGFSQLAATDTASKFTNETMDGQKVYTRAKPMPQFSGDMYQLLGDSLSYPPSAGKWKGTVYATLIIDTNGNVRNPAILKISSTDTQLPKVIETEMIAVLSRMGKWRPGNVGGKNVPIRIFLPPVTFEPPDER